MGLNEDLNIGKDGAGDNLTIDTADKLNAVDVQFCNGVMAIPDDVFDEDLNDVDDDDLDDDEDFDDVGNTEDGDEPTTVGRAQLNNPPTTIYVDPLE